VFSPNAPALFDLLGGQLVVGKRGVNVAPTGTSVFGPNFELLRGAFSNLFNPGGLNAPESLAFNIANQIEGPLAGVSKLFNKALLPGITDLARTGFKTDLSPVITQAQQRFEEDFLPALAERVSPTFSDFGTIAGREGRRIATDLGALDVQINDPVRRAGAFPIAGQIGAATAALPFNLSSDLLGLGGALRGREELGARRIAEIFAALSGQPVAGAFNVGVSEGKTDKFLGTTAGVKNITSSIRDLASIVQND
jgi:hypothetical protein